MNGRTKSAVRAHGQCLCGAVAYEVRGPLRDVVNCHCGQCRRTHGHVAAYTNTQRTDLTMVETRGLKWYRSSNEARRGFCQECGASLFWDKPARETISIAAGSLDAPTGLKTIRHIFVGEKGDYYTIDDDLEKLPLGQSPT